ncbi:hypothetical protein [Streptomyces nitrosporeus]|uniref:hypothetical protein n=1 Tax=Streptomyces nitrosporeus TaxID=28894 RepID=UPI0039A26FBD
MAQPAQLGAGDLTTTGAHEAIGLLQLLERLGPGGRGPAVGQPTADLARRLPAVQPDRT